MVWRARAARARRGTEREREGGHGTGGTGAALDARRRSRAEARSRDGGARAQEEGHAVVLREGDRVDARVARLLRVAGGRAQEVVEPGRRAEVEARVLELVERRPLGEAAHRLALALARQLRALVARTGSG